MPIRIEHAPNIGTIADAAFSVGRGEGVRKDTETAFRSAQMALDYLRDMNQYEISKAGLELKKKALEQDKEQFEKTLAARQAERDLEAKTKLALAEQEKQLMLLKEKQAHENRLTQILWENKLYRDNLYFKHALEQNKPYEYTPRQKERLEQLQLGIEWVNQKVRAGEWTPAEAKQVIDQMYMEAANIVPARPQETVDDIFAKNITVDWATGKRWLLNKDKFEPLDDISDWQKELYKHVLKYATTPITDTEGNVRLPTTEEIVSVLRSLDAAFRYKDVPSQPTKSEEQVEQTPAGPVVPREQLLKEMDTKLKNPVLPPDERVQIMQQYPELATVENVADTAAKALAPQLKGKTPEQRRQLMRQWIAERFPGHPLLKERQKVQMPQQPQLDAFQGMMQSVQPQMMTRGIP